MTVDMGGTSVDVGIIDGAIPYSTDSKLGELPLIIPAVEISSIGAGGGSVAWVDPSGVLKVGPRSAGADPGPACYGRGGTAPTLTDAYVVAGLISPEALAGGGVQLDADAALAALGELGTAIGLGPREAASAVIDVTTEKMYAQLIPVLARRGVDPVDLTMLAFGGAGPTHACLLAQEIGVRQVVVPWSPGTLCAYGALITGYRHDLVRTLGRKASSLSDGAIGAAYADLDRQARQWLAEQGVPAADALLARQADIQFPGQSFTLLVTLPPGDAATVEGLRARFLDDYAAAYGIRDHAAEIEIVNLRVSVATVPQRPPVRPGVRPGAASAAGVAGAAGRDGAATVTRAVMERGAPREALVVDRESLAPGSILTGPAVVTAADTTIYLPANCSARVDEAYNLVATIGGVDA
jgi:N-methylhydantoinase A